jgi:predicted DNA-binding protein with PD1-like motif
VHLTNVEALGGGTIAYDDAHDRIAPHIHVSVGLKEHSATGHTSHLLAATIQFLTEMLIIEVAAPVMRRIPEASLYDVPLLRIGDN